MSISLQASVVKETFDVLRFCPAGTPVAQRMADCRFRRAAIRSVLLNTSLHQTFTLASLNDVTSREAVKFNDVREPATESNRKQEP